MQLVLQPPDQRSVHFGPLVLETDLLKNQRLQQIKTNLSHAISCLPLRGVTDYNFILRLLRIARDVRRLVSTGGHEFHRSGDTSITVKIEHEERGIGPL